MLATPLNFFLESEKNTPDNVFLRQPVNGAWHVYDFRKAGDEVRRIAAAIKSMNFPPGSRIAILSKNCAHWIMADLAIMMSGFVSVPIYPTLSAAGINQILAHSEPALIFVGKLDNYEAQRSGIPGSIQKISFPLYGINDGSSWDDLLKRHQPLTSVSQPAADDLATIMYSSGTTGTPKGVMLTHGSFGYVGRNVKSSLRITKPERFISYLPLSHIAERGLMEMGSLASGSSVSFIESLDKFAENLQHEMPTIFGAVPRILLKFQEGVLKKIPQHKLDRLLAIPVVNWFIGRTIRKKLGLARARMIVAGAAPVPATLIDWFSKLGMTVREAYGMTENTAYSHVNIDKVKVGTVGQPWPGVETKIGDGGEILVRHPALMTGYYKDPETTSMVFTSDGFLKTGDQGSIDPEGFLTITGRLKDQFKTDKAKFIAPAPIELALLANRDIDQVCVVGTGIPQPIALVTLTAVAKDKDKAEVEKGLRDIMGEVNRSLEDYEQLQAAIVLRDEWTIDNGLLTPSMKVKRNEIEKIHMPKYRAWFDQKKDVIWE